MSTEKAPQTRTAKVISNFLAYALIFLALYGVWSLYSGGSSDNVSITQFMQTANTPGAIAEMRIADDGQTIEYYANDKWNTTVVPTGANEIGITLIETGVPVFAEPVKVASAYGAKNIGIMLAIGIVPVLLLIGAMVFIARRAGKGSPVGDFGKSKAVRIDPADIDVSFADVALSPEDRVEIQELAEYLKTPEDYIKVNAKPPKGILLCGPPGCGKTLVCRAIAKEANVPFFSVSGSEFDEMLVGAGASRVRSLFEDAKKEGTAIVFIDEIDAVGGNRFNPLSGSNNGQTVNQILTAMSGFSDNNVIVIGATNRPDVLDPALTRPGRFDRKVTLGLPDIATRKHALQIHLKKVVQDLPESVVDDLAKSTPGFSGADLAMLVNEGAIFTARDKRDTVTEEDLHRAKDKVMMGTESPRKMNPKEVELTAYHEAGHTIVGWSVPEHDEVYKVSIIPRAMALGVTMFLPEDEKYSLSKTALNSQVITLLAGRAAEEIHVGKDMVTTGASNDLERATDICRAMVTKWGLSGLGLAKYATTSGYGAVKEYSEEYAQRIDDEVDRMMSACFKSAMDILLDKADTLKLMSEELIEHETLDKDAIDTIMRK